ncbi:MAG: dipeptidase [Eubacteriales bacterium]|nr:dipeptidase [Eubacteriales bacterium]
MFPVADGHCDFLYGAVQSGYELKQPKREQTIQMDGLLRGGVALQFFACWIDTALRIPPLHQCVAMIDAYQRMLDQNPELVPFSKSFSPENGNIATLLTIEGGEAIDGSLAVLRVLYRLGVRAMTLTWNENNELSGAAMGRGNKGLTAIGRDVIDEMCSIGMAIDVSHLSDHAIEQVLARTTRPVFASHSNARSVLDHPRSLPDDLIREIAAQDGTIGVNFYYQQLTKSAEACIEDIANHICHIVHIGGIDCCAIGSDFDGMQQYPRDLRTSRDFPALFSALARRGFTQDEIYRIAYQNLRDYIVHFV